MKKQARQLVGMLVVLAVLAAGFAALRKYNEAQAAKPAEEDSIRLNDLEQDEIVGISYDYGDETYVFEKEEDTWYYAEDHTRNLIQYRLSTMASYLAPLEVEEVIGNVTDYEQYGLENPEGHISFQTAEDSFGIWVGDFNSMEQAYYIRLDGDNNVYLVQSKFMTVFDYALEDLTEEEASSVSENKT